jgi:hypothetical protein
VIGNREKVSVSADLACGACFLIKFIINKINDLFIFFLVFV